MNKTLSEQLKSETRQAHTAAERTGIVRDLIRGQADKHSYLLYLRNLGEVYLELEHALGALVDGHPLSFFASSELYRYNAIQEDVASLASASLQLPVLPATLKYCQHIKDAAGNSQHKLLAHAYVRYVGDLSGGQIMSKVMTKTGFVDGEECSSTRFYEFPDICDTDAYKKKLRAAIDTFGHAQPEVESIVDEANLAFGLNMSLSEAVTAQRT